MVGSPPDEREVPLNLYRHGAALPVRVRENRRLTVAGNPNDVHHIVLEFPEGQFSYLEGQSVGIAPPGLNARGRPNVPRLYSSASDRLGDDGLGNTLTLTVKRVVYKNDAGVEVRGLASNVLCDAQPGDVLPMSGPAGREFVLPEEESSNYLMFATGTGVAPFRAFAQRHAKWPTETRGKMWLFFGVRAQDDALYADQWPMWSHNDDFRVTWALSREQQTPDGRRMYVQDRMRESGRELLKFLGRGRTHVYICGIKGMEVGISEAFAAIAKEAGLNWTDVHEMLWQTGRWHQEVY